MAGTPGPAGGGHEDRKVMGLGFRVWGDKDRKVIGKREERNGLGQSEVEFQGAGPQDSGLKP